MAPSLLRVLDRLADTPALILNSLGETLVANRLAVAIFGDRAPAIGWARSDVYRWFNDPASRALYPAADRDRQARSPVASLRSAYGIAGSRSRVGELVRLLLAESEEFASIWARHEVAVRFADHKTLVHRGRRHRGGLPGAVHRGPVAGPASAHPAPSSAAEEKISLLSVLAGESFEVSADH